MPVANMLTVWELASSSTAGGLPASVENDGASLTAATVMVNVWTADVLTRAVGNTAIVRESDLKRCGAVGVCRRLVGQRAGRRVNGWRRAECKGAAGEFVVTVNR